ncbi:MAG: M20 family metallopeptidase [Chloroflexota bacterium]
MIDYFAEKEWDILPLGMMLIEHQSFTTSKEDVDELVEYITEQLEPLTPSSITRMPQDDVGDILLAKWHEDAPGKPIMILMHLDTVHPRHEIGEDMHFGISDDDERLLGPGAVDMKGGILVAITAVKGLVERGELPERPLWLLFTTDEETGSKVSTPIIKDLAKQCGLVLVMEFPTDEGALKTARKGIATYTIETQGVAAHAGNHPERGVNAVLEMAEQIIQINKLQNLRGGISVAVNTIEGGSAGNVIADYAKATIDVRTITRFDLDNVHEELMELRPRIPGAQVEVTLHHMRGPMERDDQMAATFKQAQQLAKSIGLKVYEESVGGASDGNTVAALGIPVLDGLGPRGGGAHTKGEFAYIRSIYERAAHIAVIIRDWEF